MKHNKKRNTAFLYETLVKEMTKAALHSDLEARSAISSILVEHFHTSSLLHRELNLYKTLCEVRNVERRTAEKILAEVKRVYHSLGEGEIFDEQTQVIKKINTNLSKKVYNNFVSNYKTLATISQMFNSRTPITKKVILEDTLVDQMTKLPNERQAMRPIDNLTYKMFVQKFNHKYGNSLNEHQKNLLSRYVTLSPENAVEFKLYINDEVGRLKEVVKKLQAKKEVLLDESLGQKNREILGVLENFKTQRINDEMIKTILKMQALAVEA
tara:strand:+ start:3715 stop:4521 length:807 start_codon:yes stop_codon:yes gene_type:complete